MRPSGRKSGRRAGLVVVALATVATCLSVALPRVASGPVRECDNGKADAAPAMQIGGVQIATTAAPAMSCPVR